LLSRLKARSFRNLTSLDWSPGPGRHLLLGPNGAGKTSVLEAVYTVATTKSFRTARLAEAVCHDRGGFELEGEVETERRTRLTVGWGRPEGLRRTVNGDAVPLAQHLAVLPVVAWTAAEADLLTGAPRLRRRLLDRGVVGLRPATLELLSRYRQALAQKREALGDAARRSPLEPWNEILAETTAGILQARDEYVGRLGAAWREVLAICGLPFPSLELRYRPSPRRGLEGRGAVAAVLDRVLDRERAAGIPLVGPHRDDLEILWGSRAAREVVSAGERKALTLTLVAAHGRVMTAAGRRPVHLLDDADAELARDTLERAWRGYSDAEQVFASSNRPEVWEGLGVDRAWRLAGGRMEDS
jgi:DNA replication and repair protein RecF